jgi:hypothetical protein
MSRKRDTNWTRDEISVLLDSIMEITKMRAADGKRTNSREVFEYAAKKLGEKGHTSRAEREKCRTKWKKMKEEFNHAKKARETGEGRVAPGIEPFYSRMLEFNNGNFQNISPHSTIVRRSSSISSNMNNVSYGSSSNLNHNGNSHNSSSNTDDGPVPQSSSAVPAPTMASGNKPIQSGSRASARIAANSNGNIVLNETSDTSSTIETRQANSDYSPVNLASTDSSPMSRQHSRLITSSTINGSGGTPNGIYPSTTPIQIESTPINHHLQLHRHQNNPSHAQLNDTQRVVHNGYACNSLSSSTKTNPDMATNDNINGSLNADAVNLVHRDTDISYRVSSGFRQITIFGHHDVDIKFRENCVTINKIGPDYAPSSAAGHGSDS